MLFIKLATAKPSEYSVFSGVLAKSLMMFALTMLELGRALGHKRLHAFFLVMRGK